MSRGDRQARIDGDLAEAVTVQPGCERLSFSAAVNATLRAALGLPAPRSAGTPPGPAVAPGSASGPPDVDARQTHQDPAGASLGPPGGVGRSVARAGAQDASPGRATSAGRIGGKCRHRNTLGDRCVSCGKRVF